MEETTIQPDQEQEPMSFTDKIINVFASPGELYEEVALSGKTNSNWSVPLLLLLVFVIISTVVMFTQPAIIDQMKEIQAKAMQSYVESGRMSQEDVERALESPVSSPGSPFFLIMVSVSAVVMVIAVLFGVSLAYWLVGKFLWKGNVPYLKVAEVIGLASYISIVSSLVTTGMIVGMGSMFATPSLALLVSQFNPEDKLHKVLNVVNLFTLWYLGVIAVGLSKVYKKSLGQTLAVTAVFFVLFAAVIYLI